MLDAIALNLEGVAIAMVRMVLGVLFLFQAYDKIFTVGLKEFTRMVTSGAKKKGVPLVFIRLSTHLSSYFELFAGIMLILGLFLPFAYILMAFNIVMVSMSFSFLQALWDMKHVFPRLVMLAFLMITYELDRFRLELLF